MDLVHQTGASRSLKVAVLRTFGTTAPLVFATTLVGFTLALLAVIRLGLPVWSLLLILAPLVYAIAVAQRPILGLFAVTCILFLPLKIGAFTLLQTIGVGTAGIVAIRFLHERRSIRLGTIFLPLCCIGVLIVVSFFFARDSATTVHYFRIWLFNLAFYVLLVNLIADFDDLKKIVWAIVLIASVNAVVGMIDYATSSEPWGYRSAGVMENALELGNLSALAFPLALYQYLYRRGPLKWIGLALTAVLAGGVVASVSRGPLVALLAAFGLMLITERRRIGALALVIVLALAATPILPIYFYERVDNLVGQIKGTILLGEEEETTIRGYYNKGGLRIWLAHPVLGVGVGNFGHYFIQREFNPGAEASTGVATHNIYLEALVEMGMLGFSVLIWLIVATLRNVLRARRAARDDSAWWTYIGGIEMAALIIFIASFSSGSLMSQSFWLFVSLPAVGSRLVAASESAEPSGERRAA